MRHLRAFHEEAFDEFTTKSNETKLKVKINPFKRCNSYKTFGHSSAKQTKITKFIQHSRTMKDAVELAVNNGVSFSLFDSSAMRSLTSRAGGGEDSEKIVSSENVKSAITEMAKEKREEMKRLIQDKVINITADFATCQRRSFFGM